MKTSVEEPSSRLDLAEEIISELELKCPVWESRTKENEDIEQA